MGKKNKDAKAYNEWQDLLNSFPVKAREKTIKLREEYCFPNKNLDELNKFHAPLYLCMDSVGNIYVSDRVHHSVHKFDSKGEYLNRIGKAGHSEGELLIPSHIDVDHKNNLIVHDIGNNRIQIFDQQGKYISHFKIFKGYTSMAVDSHELIYFSHHTDDLNEPLVEVLDMNGKLIRSFGKRIEFEHNSPAHNKIMISINNKDEVFLTWKYFPFVRRYSPLGNLLSEYEINYDLLNELAKPNFDAKLIKNSIRMRSVLEGIIGFEDRFYLFIQYPRPEILEIDLNGIINYVYWDEPISYRSLLTDFLVSHDNKNNLIHFYTLVVFPEPHIKLYISHFP
jgi:hypothetical protein